MHNIAKVLVSIGSGASIGFGVWHFFVPRVWKWYSYMNPGATELIAAVRAVNLFFSLSLVLFGALNLLFMFGSYSNRYSVIVLLTANSILWLTRSIYQVIFPQGSLYPGLQYGMLSAFVFIAFCYVAALVMILCHKFGG